MSCCQLPVHLSAASRRASLKFIRGQTPRKLIGCPQDFSQGPLGSLTRGAPKPHSVSLAATCYSTPSASSTASQSLEPSARQGRLAPRVQRPEASANFQCRAGVSGVPARRKRRRRLQTFTAERGSQGSPRGANAGGVCKLSVPSGGLRGPREAQTPEAFANW